jgi:crossover junction endodeoxyribonuclease RusA
MTTAARVDAPWGGVPYQRSVPVLTFALLGLPISQGSKSFKGISRSGRAIMVESAKGLKPWRQTVQAAIEVAMKRADAKFTVTPPLGWPLLGPVAIDLVFTMRRPLSAPKRRRTWPIVYPDLSKCVRAVEDAATYAGLWHDDAQVVDLHAWKVYPLETPRALRAPGLAAAVYLIDEPRPAAGEQAALL